MISIKMLQDLTEKIKALRDLASSHVIILICGASLHGMWVLLPWTAWCMEVPVLKVLRVPSFKRWTFVGASLKSDV
jgi:hypothetical protein